MAHIIIATGAAVGVGLGLLYFYRSGPRVTTIETHSSTDKDESSGA